MIRRDRVAYVLKNNEKSPATTQAAAPKRRRVDDDPFDVFDAELYDDLNDTQLNGANDSFLEPTAIHLEETTLDDVKQAMLFRMDCLEKNVTLMFKRVFTEVITLRKENAILRSTIKETLEKNEALLKIVELTKKEALAKKPTTSTFDNSFDTESFDPDESTREAPQMRTSFKKVTDLKPVTCSGGTNRKTVGKTKFGKAMDMPFTVLEDFLKFEQHISENAEAEQRFVDEFATLYSTKRDSFPAALWRGVMTDQVAKHMSWAGTETKKSVRDLTVTTALQNAFQRRFEDDGIYVRNSQKFFRYANDRLKKNEEYAKRIKLHRPQPK